MKLSTHIGRCELANATLEMLEKAYGIKANPSGLIADKRLRECFAVLEVIREDWMHGALEDGTLYVSCQCLLVRLKQKLDWDTDRLERFLRADWDFPKVTANKMRNVWHLFDSYARSHMDNRIKFKSTASELLGMYVLLRHWVLSVVAVQPLDLTAEIDAFRAQCRVVDHIMTLKKGLADQACAEEVLAELRAAVEVSLRLHIATYGTEMVRPKHHRMHHIPTQIARDKWVVDAFVMERLHLVVKESFAYLRNHADVEASLLRGSMLRQIERLKEKHFYGLLGRQVPLRGFPGCLAAKEMHYSGMTIAARDVVLRDGAAGRVIACAAEQSNMFVLVQVWASTAAITPHSQRWRTTDVVQAWRVENITQAVAWYSEGDDFIVLTE